MEREGFPPRQHDAEVDIEAASSPVGAGCSSFSDVPMSSFPREVLCCLFNMVN